MKKYQLYIAHVLLAGFLFPQVLNAVHYLVQTHSVHSNLGERHDITASTYDYHNCEYHFNSLKYNIPSGDQFELSIFVPGERKEKYFYKPGFVNELAFHYSLRGPPPIPV